jgi:hypothetical protein
LQVCKLACILLVVRASSAANHQRSCLNEDSLDALMRVFELAPAVGTFAAEDLCRKAVHMFNGGNRRPGNSRQGPRPPRRTKHAVQVPTTVDPVSGLCLPV